MNMIFDIFHMDMLSVYGVLCLHNCCLEWLWIESFKNMVLSSLSLQEPYLLLRIMPITGCSDISVRLTATVGVPLIQSINKLKYIYDSSLPLVELITLTLG